MGLDMYAYATSRKIKEQIDFVSSDLDHEIQYWRKNNALHGWMQRLYVNKGGSIDPSDFNCVNLKLCSDDLDQLEQDIQEGAMKPTSGFFFGEQNYSEDDKKTDIGFIRKARMNIADGLTVYYTSWW
jgi:hypothetical protein